MHSSYLKFHSVGWFYNEYAIELVLDRFGKQEGLYKSISLSFVLLEITERKILMSATENATVLKLFLF